MAFKKEIEKENPLIELEMFLEWNKTKVTLGS